MWEPELSTKDYIVQLQLNRAYRIKEILFSHT